MTADEIRRMVKLGPARPWNWFGRTRRLQLFYLNEIAAQLAELNAREDRIYGHGERRSAGPKEIAEHMAMRNRGEV